MAKGLGSDKTTLYRLGTGKCQNAHRDLEFREQKFGADVRYENSPSIPPSELKENVTQQLG